MELPALRPRLPGSDAKPGAKHGRIRRSAGRLGRPRRTRSLAAAGVAVGVLHTGRHYADDRDSSGIVYHYPRTQRPASRDSGEISALKEAEALGLPVFVVSNTRGGSRRQVELGWVVGHDDAAEVVLILFGDARPAVSTDRPPPAAPFPAKVKRAKRTTVTETYERDPEFAFRVQRRFAGCCPFSGISVPEMLDAAHVIPVADGGPDDERNGLLLSAGIHRALDAGLWCLDPVTLAVVTRSQGPAPSDMGMVNARLSASVAPHIDALVWLQDVFRKRWVSSCSRVRRSPDASCGEAGGRPQSRRGSAHSGRTRDCVGPETDGNRRETFPQVRPC